MRRASIALTFALLLSATAYVGATVVDDPAERVRDRVGIRGAVTVADRLYCGMSIAGGGVVTDAQLEQFVTEVVEPRFPDGFTMWRARGAWMGGREETAVIEIGHVNDVEANRRVKEIATEYARRFQQSAVLRMTVPARLEFIGG